MEENIINESTPMEGQGVVISTTDKKLSVKFESPIDSKIGKSVSIKFVDNVMEVSFNSTLKDVESAKAQFYFMETNGRKLWFMPIYSECGHYCETTPERSTILNYHPKDAIKHNINGYLCVSDSDNTEILSFLNSATGDYISNIKLKPSLFLE